MTTQTLLILFLVLFVLNILASFVLEKLNISWMRKHPKTPKEFSNDISSDEYARSQQYTTDKSHFSVASLIFNTAITLIILFSGVLPFVDTATESLWFSSPNTISHSVLFIFILSFMSGLPSLPFKLYSTFILEAKYGFNKQTMKSFFIDELKGLVLSLLLGVPFLFAVFWFFNTSGSLWWIWLFTFIAGFQMIMMVIYPIVIAPLFNKFEPLQEGDLKESLNALAEKTSFHAQGIYVMDGSKRSGHSNAYFTGFGSFRRIVLYDTLIEQLSIPELTAVLAHEIGHYKKKHIYKMLVSAMIFLFVGLYVLSLAINWPTMYQTFNVSISNHMGLFLFMTLSSTALFFISPFTNLFSRKHEYEADAYAVEITKDPESMKNALKLLSQKNLSNLTPHPFYSQFYYSHPTTVERIGAIDSISLP